MYSNMYNSYSYEIPMLITYAQAAAHEASIKPIRGRRVECKPLGERRKDYMRIGKMGKDIIVYLYSTDVLTYKPDGRVLLNYGGYTTQTTNQVLGEVLGVRIAMKDGNPWMHRFRASDGTHKDATLLNRDKPTTLKRTKNGLWEASGVEPVYRLEVVRKEANKVLKEYAPALKYMKGMAKLRQDEHGVIQFEDVGIQFPSPAAMQKLKEGADVEHLHTMFTYFMQVGRNNTQHPYWGREPTVRVETITQKARQLIYAYEYFTTGRCLVKEERVSFGMSNDPYTTLIRAFKERERWVVWGEEHRPSWLLNSTHPDCGLQEAAQGLIERLRHMEMTNKHYNSAYIDVPNMDLGDIAMPVVNRCAEL